MDLYEFAMNGANKPSEDCYVFLLRKVAIGKQLDLSLFFRVVRIFTESGNFLTNSMLGAVLKSLTSVGRLGECNKVLKPMKEGGFMANCHLQSKIAFQLSSTTKKDEASELMENMESSGSTLDHRTWASFIKGHCVAWDFDNASNCFKSFQLSSTTKKDEASELMENMESSGSTLDHRTWASLDRKSVV